MDDYDRNEGIDDATDTVKEQLRCVNNACCASHLHMVIKRLEDKKIKESRESVLSEQARADLGFKTKKEKE